MVTDVEVRYVTNMTPVDLTGVKDNGIRAVTLLAASLGWNVMQKINNPLVLTARDGTSKRLPTNTSIRMSVFQTALSTVIAHTEPDVAPTIELVDKIIAATKPSRDHERRLRLAVGESPAEHRERLSNDRAAEQLRTPEEHLVHYPEIPMQEVEEVAEEVVEVPEAAARAAVDGGEHGVIVSRKPFEALQQSNEKFKNRYTSDSSFECVWTDGYTDYECQVCFKAYSTPKGVGSHRQEHYKDGTLDRSGEPAWKRALMRRDPSQPPKKRRSRKEVAAQVIPSYHDLEFIEELPADGAIADEVTHYVGDDCDPPHEKVLAEAADLLTDQADILGQIANLVLPGLIEERDYWMQRAEKAEADFVQLMGQYTQVTSDWNALKELISGR